MLSVCLLPVLFLRSAVFFCLRIVIQLHAIMQENSHLSRPHRMLTEQIPPNPAVVSHARLADNLKALSRAYLADTATWFRGLLSNP